MARAVVGDRSKTAPLIVVVAVALVALGLLGRNVVPPTPTPSPSPAVAESPAPSPSGAGVELVWDRLPVDAAAFESAVVGTVASVHAGLIAFGQDVADLHPIVWLSSDGVAWVRHDEPASTFGGGVPDVAVQVRGAILALGYHANPGGATRDVWVSTDGISWHRTRSATGRDLTYVPSLVADGTRGVLLAQTAQGAIVASTEDGDRWEHAASDDPISSGSESLQSAIATDPGFLAVGHSLNGGVVYRSSDGVRWSAVDAGDAFEDAYLQGVSRIRTGVVASGQDGRRNADSAWWVSADGTEWSQARRSPVAQIAKVFRLDAGDVIVSADYGAPLTASVDDADWTVVLNTPTGAADLARQAAVLAGRLVVLATDPDVAFAAWTGRVVGASSAAPAGAATIGPARSTGPTPPSVGPTSPPAAVAEPVDWRQLRSRAAFESDLGELSMTTVVALDAGWLVFGNDGQHVAIWQASDPVRWKRLAPAESMRDGYVTAAARRGSRVVAVGWQAGMSDNVPVAWTSTDARTWERVVADTGGGMLADVVAGPDGFVALGSLASGPVPLFSTDGRTWSRGSIRDAVDPVLAAVAYGHGVYVAVGTDHSGASGRPAVWRSSDGRSWEEVADPGIESATATPHSQSAGLYDVASTADGFVAVGAVDRGSIRSAVFTSKDGRAWEEIPLDAEMADLPLARVDAIDGGFAVVGAGMWAAPWLWLFRGAWEPVDRIALGDDSASGSRVSINDVVSTPLGPMAIGYGRSVDGRSVAAVWIGSTGAPIPDHACPASIDLEVLLAMTSADQAGCLAGHPVTVQGLARTEVGDCSNGGSSELTWCSPQVYVRASTSAFSILGATADHGVSAKLPTSEAPWRLTIESGITSPSCTPVRGPNGVAYEGPMVTKLLCVSLLHATDGEPVAP